METMSMWCLHNNRGEESIRTRTRCPEYGSRSIALIRCFSVDQKRSPCGSDPEDLSSTAQECFGYNLANRLAHRRAQLPLGGFIEIQQPQAANVTQVLQLPDQHAAAEFAERLR